MKNQTQLLADLDTTLKSVTVSSQHIDTLALNANDMVTGDGKRTLANLDSAATQLKATATDARTLIGRLQGPTTDFANNGLPQLSRTVISLQTAAESLDRLVGEVEQNPRQLLTKSPAKTVQVKP